MARNLLSLPLFLGLIEGHGAQVVAPGPGGWYRQNLKTNPHGGVRRTEQPVASAAQLCPEKLYVRAGWKVLLSPKSFGLMTHVAFKIHY